MIFLKITNQWGSYELIALDNIRGITPARNPAQTIIRLKTGGYSISNVNYAETEGYLRHCGATII